MTEQAPIPLKRPGQSGDPLIEGIQTPRRYDMHSLDDPNGQRLSSALNREAFDKTHGHEQVADLIKFAPEEDKPGLRKGLGGALLRNTLNADQAEVFAQAGKQEFETAIDETKQFTSQVNGNRSERREAKRALRKAHDAEKIGLSQGATALAEAQAVTIQAERRNHQEQIVKDELKRAA